MGREREVAKLNGRRGCFPGGGRKEEEKQEEAGVGE